MPLTIGYVVLALVLIIVCVDVTSLYLAQRRVEAVADAAALAGADGFELDVRSGDPVARLTNAGVHAQASDIVLAHGEATLVHASSPDGTSARVSVSAVWHPPITSIFVPDGVVVQATATSRTAFADTLGD